MKEISYSEEMNKDIIDYQHNRNLSISVINNN